MVPWPCFMGAMVSFPSEDITYVVKSTFAFLLELSVSPELIEISMSVHRAGWMVDLAQGLSSRKLIFYWGVPQMPLSVSLLNQLVYPADTSPISSSQHSGSPTGEEVGDHIVQDGLSLNPRFPCGALPTPSALPGVFPKSRVSLLRPIQRILPVFSDLQNY